MKPFGIVTKRGKFAGGDVLSQYATKGSRQVGQDAFNKTYGKGLVKPLYNPDTLARALEMNTYHYRCCRVKARDTAGLGWALKPVVENPNEQQYDQLQDFFDGQDVPISSTFNQAQFDFEGIGYGAIEVIRVDHNPAGYPEQLKHIPSHTLRVHKSGNLFCQMRNNKRVWFKAIGYEKDVDYKTGREYPLGSLPENKRATEILWFANYTPRSDYYGLPDIIPALGAVHGDISRRDFNIAFFDNFGVPAYAVFITGNFQDEPRLDSDGKETGETVLQHEIEEHFKELAKNPHSTLILTIPTKAGAEEVKVDFEPLAVETKEASFRLYRKDNRDEVLSAHGVPPYRVGVAETGNLGGTTAAEATEIYKRSVIEPRQETLETILNRHIILEAFDIKDWRYEFAEIDTADEAHDLDVLQALFGMAAVTPNQIIRHFKDRFGLEEVDRPEMNTHYLNNNPLYAVGEAGPSLAVVGAPALVNGGLMTVNEIRAVFGLPPVPGGDDLREPDDPQEAAMMSLEERLLEVAEKHEPGIRDGLGNPRGIKKAKGRKGGSS